LYQEALALASSQDLPALKAFALMGIGWLAIRQGDDAHGRPPIEDGLGVLRTVGIRNSAFIGSLSGYALYLVIRGEVDTARAYLVESLTLSRASGNWLHGLAALGVAAGLLQREGDAGRAVILFGAVASARSSRPVPLPPGYAGMHDSAIKQARARLNAAAFAAAWAQGERLSVSAAVEMALAALTNTSTSEPSTELQRVGDSGRPGLDSNLSPREVEVLRLIAAGKSNREIGEALVISVNTVIRHVAHIFAKTGCANRAEAAAYATRHGLAG
jgi:non-specific serine/threonine protein kinase